MVNSFFNTKSYHILNSFRASLREDQRNVVTAKGPWSRRWSPRFSPSRPGPLCCSQALATSLPATLWLPGQSPAPLQVRPKVTPVTSRCPTLDHTHCYYLEAGPPLAVPVPEAPHPLTALMSFQPFPSHLARLHWSSGPRCPKSSGGSQLKPIPRTLG